MLQRLVNKPPIPLDALPNDPLIFDLDGELKSYVVNICLDNNIDHNDLIPKSVEDFFEKGSPLNVQILRYNQYESQRREKLKMLPDLIKEYIKSKKAARKQKDKELPKLTEFQQPTNMTMTTKHGEEKQHRGELLMRIRKSETPTTKMFTGESVFKTQSESHHGLTSSNRREIRKERNKSQGTESEDGSVLSLLRENYIRQMKFRMMEQERILNAPVIVQQREEELRKKIQEEQTEKEKKWEEKRKELSLLNKRTKKPEKKRIPIRVNIREERKKIEEKLSQSEIRRKEEFDKKCERIKKRNEIVHQKHLSLLERKDEYEELSQEILKDIEERHFESNERKRKFLQEKQAQCTLSVRNPEEKIRRSEELRENQKNKIIQEIGEKMDKARQGNNMQSKFRKSLDLEEFKIRRDQLKKIERSEMRKSFEEFAEKERKITERLREKRNNLEDYIAERKEREHQRFNRVRMNLTMAEEEHRSWLDNLGTFYQTRLESVKREKEWRNQHLNLLGKVDKSIFKE